MMGAATILPVRTGAAPPMTTPPSPRPELMTQHAEARRRRDAAELDSPEYRAACEEVARIEVAIALAEEPAATSPAS